ncbi:MAG: hypothetical protein ABR880_21250 [Candidatus Sulfotelmatobacter sp.]|jgi:hypothetical protein
MSLGIAAVIIFVLYLIDKHGRWRQTAKITTALIVLVLLGWGGLLGYDKYDSWRRAKAEHAAAVTACVARNGSDPTTQKACEADPNVEVRVKVTANFVKCGVDAEGHIFSDGNGGCIPPPPDGFVMDAEPHGDIFDKVAREDCQKRLMKQVHIEGLPAGSVLGSVVKACNQDPAGEWAFDSKTNIWLNQSKRVPVPPNAVISP